MLRGGALALVATLALASCSGARGGDAHPSLDGAPVTRADATADLRTLVETIDAVHPNAYFHTPKDAVDRAVDATIERLPAVESRVDFFKQAASIVTSLGDAHTTMPPYLADIDAYTENGGRLFPLVVRFQNDLPVVAIDLEPESPVPVGAIVDTIGDRPALGVIDDAGRYVSAETPALRRSFVAEDLREWMYIEGLRPPYRVTYHLPGDASKTIELGGATGDAFDDWDASDPGVRYAAPTRFTMLEDGVGDLTIHSFDNDDGAFAKSLPATFRQIASARPKALLIDVRENDGGTTDAVSDVLDYLTTKPFSIESYDLTKVSAIVKHSLGHKKYADLYDEDAWKAPNGTTVDETIAPDAPDDVADRFTGKVYVLEGPGTFSSAAIFAAAVQDARIGTILGETSGGLPTLYANGYDFTLPRTKLDASVSTEYSVRPSGDRGEHGVVPDRTLEPTSELGRDRELASAVALIEADLATSR